MEKISEFFIEHWLIILCINITAIIAIIIYLILEIKQKKTNNKGEKNSNLDNRNENHNIIENDQVSSNKIINKEISLSRESENIKPIKNNIEINSNNQNEKLNESIEENDNSSKILQNNPINIVEEDNKSFEELDKLLPDKKIIPDELKDKLETFEDIKPIKETDKKIIINTDIELPEITLSTKEEDIWD